MRGAGGRLFRMLPWRSMGWAAPASALGFVAYEFAEFADAEAFA